MELYIVVDFGSANSGCACMIKNSRETTPYLLHKKKTSNYAKEETKFAVKSDFLKRLNIDYFSIEDSDFVIKSDTEGLIATDNPNIAWREETLSELRDDDFIFFERFKMCLYKNNREIKDRKVLGSDKCEYPVSLIIKVFLRLLKIDSIVAIKKIMGLQINDGTEMHWGITIPSIWGDCEKQLMRDIAVSVFGKDVTILSEPQSAMTYFLNFGGEGDSRLQNGNVSVVVDAGGGTTDLACVVESCVDVDSFSVQSVNLPNGVGYAGNNIDNEFWIELCNYLVEKSQCRERYEKTSDLYDELIGSYMKESPEGRRDFYNEWRNIQYNCYEKNNLNLYFGFRKDYRQWLKKNKHHEIWEYLKEEEFEVPIPRSIVDKCHNVIICEKIIPEVDKFISNILQRFDKVDRLILAGGLSFVSPFKNEVIKLQRKYNISDLQSCAFGKSDYSAVTKCSGAVLMGAVYQLMYPNSMVYTAVKSFFYDVYTTEKALITKRIEEYAPFGFASTLFPCYSVSEQQQLLFRELDTYAKKSADYKEIKYFEGEAHVHSLSPICVEGCLSTNFKRKLFLLNPNERKIEFDIYVSDNPYALYCSKSNPEIVKLDTILIYLKKNIKSVLLEVLFNNAQNSNPIEVVIKDDLGNLIKSILIEPQYRKGY